MGACCYSIRWSRLSDPGMGDVDVSAEYPITFCVLLLQVSYT